MRATSIRISAIFRRVGFKDSESSSKEAISGPSSRVEGKEVDLVRGGVSFSLTGLASREGAL